ncbi:hypothetical protein CFOL_v3_01663 [Cephalotus follicularis]|uniref:50S ribosomal protein 5, chloroplastic n=1 Tax=Cephalotus follicularis TaxID=3775 RepID=A0A1Q3AQX5_CEPFO|nr:hypothetical protein CFOL_v3_01663 [Cephalotus follicularis]
MALLLTFNFLSSPSPPSSSSVSSAFTITASQSSRLHIIPNFDHQKLNSFTRVGIYSPIITHKIGSMIIKALAGVDSTLPTENVEDPLESKEDKVVPVDKLPLESKLQEKLDQKLRMKLAKKIRLRRNRLVRKRRLRKKGRWPPSKMRSLKNV